MKVSQIHEMELFVLYKMKHIPDQLFVLNF